MDEQPKFAQRERPLRLSRGQWYVLALFMVVHVMLGVDRAILSVLAEPIKREFGLSDTQLGILVGIGFSAFYSVAGLILGWAVDNLDRSRILAACVVVFGAATASAGWAGSFVHLLASRLLVGAGEAGGGPAMVSILSERFPPARRGLAMSVFYAGAPLGLLCTFLLGGLIASTYGWRTTFLVAGLPAIVLGLLAGFTVDDSGRRKNADPNVLPFRAALRHIAGQRSARLILTGVIFYTGSLTAMVAFLTSFLMRAHGLSLASASAFLALAFGGAGAIGAPLSGYIVDRLAARDMRWRSWWCAATLLASFALSVSALMVDGTAGALALFCVWGLFSNAVSGPGVATYQSVLAVRARGVGMAIYYLVAHLLGSTCGALLTGVLSDHFEARWSHLSLRYALVAVAFANLVGAWLWFRSATTVEEDTLRAHRMEAARDVMVSRR
ncbi:MFS transporter [Novosphingobium sp. BL-52-GroH]|uniref:MFS transporter n=1 Tax=Novosphingobium sp. BL-52-GroH TaxID=3349877 RepID=UPI00384C43BA